MDETIEILVEKIKNSLSGWSFSDQSFIMTEISDRLKKEAHGCLEKEYGLTEEIL